MINTSQIRLFITFSDEWLEFFENINQIVEAKNNYGNQDSQQIIDTVGDITYSLVEQDALTRVEYEVSELNRNAKTFLMQEVEMWNGAATTAFDQGAPPESEMNELLTDGQTVKDSLEQQLSLPNWMSRLLSILNEIIDLIT